LSGADVGQTRLVSAADARQKAPYMTGVVLCRGRRQATFLPQPARIFLQYRLDAQRPDRNGKLVVDDTLVSEPVRYPAQGDRVAVLENAVSGAVTQERSFMFGGDLASRNPLLTQPPAELADEEGLLPVGDLRISAISEVFSIWLEVRGQWTLDPKPRAPLSTCSSHRPNPCQPARVGQNYADRLPPI
jgi:hypothetical protein